MDLVAGWWTCSCILDFTDSHATDVDAVFRIGYIVSTMDMSLREWVVSACSMAKARMAVVLVAGRQINWNKMPVRNEWVREVEALAKKGYPPAMLLQAKILGLRNQYNEAFTLLENEVLPFLSPTRQSPVFFQDILLGGQFESPWRLYALLLARYDSQYNCKESRARSDEALRIAALEYQDADALIEYASVMMNENNLDMYEECMSKAATAGKSNACLFLANFYYLTFHGKYPTRGERTKQLNGQVPESTPKTGSKSPDPTPTTTPSPGSKTVVSSAYKWITSFFQQAMAREDYRNLAADWYHLAYWHGEAKAAFMVALIWRENGEKVKGRIFLDYAAKLDQDADFAGKMQALRTHWYDDDFHPTLPRKMLEVR